MEEKGRCKFWLSKKNRFCANAPLLDSQFCGNHKPRSDGQRLPCPIDPSHFVLKENLEGHLKRCPLMKQSQSLSLQPFYRKGINAGDDDGSDIVSSEMKRSAIYSMSVEEFCNLIKKIEGIHSSLCADIWESHLLPEACNVWIKREVDRKLPFQEKHVLQQASILGNLEHFGVLGRSAVRRRCDKEGLTRNRGECAPAVVEFGAGRGYLTQMLADCYGIEKVFLVERKSYKLKADRSLRQKESLLLERLRVDIEDLNLNSVESLKGVPYLAIGKHLCGPATDLTLRCCLSQQCHQDTIEELKNGDVNVQGLAIATCCHHLCQWKQYINKEFFLNLGITKEEFNAITWFTSWAVDANHGSDFPHPASCKSQLQTIEEIRQEGEVDRVEDFIRKIAVVERAILGFMCKQIIDMGRKIWAKERALDTHLFKYVPLNISPENLLLIAKHP